MLNLEKGCLFFLTSWDSGLRDCSLLKLFEHASSVRISGKFVSAISDLAEMQELKVLILEREVKRQFKDLSVLESIELETLRFVKPDQQDLDQISKGAVKNLVLVGGSYKSLSSVLEMGLDSLELIRSPLVEIDGNTTIPRLHIAYCNKTVSFHGTSKSEHLMIETCKNFDLGTLGSFVNLKNLWLVSNQFSSYQALPRLEKLEKLNVTNTDLLATPSPEQLPALTKLWVSPCSDEGIDEIGGDFPNVLVTNGNILTREGKRRPVSEYDQ